MERMGEKSSQKLIDAIDRSRGRGLARLVNALSIRYVGNRVAQILADHFGSLENLREAEVEEITAIDEIGPIIARSVYDFFHGEQGRRIVEDLKSEDLLTQKETGDEPAIPREVKSVLEGKKVVVTGTLPSMSREEAHALIEQLGGRAVSSVSSKTDYLLAGEDPGSKLDKAKEHDIPIISEDDLKSMLQKEIDDTEGLRRAAEKTAPELFE
jgi:DNA ligase (NAD+)